MRWMKILTAIINKRTKKDTEESFKWKQQQERTHSKKNPTAKIRERKLSEKLKEASIKHKDIN